MPFRAIAQPFLYYKTGENREWVPNRKSHSLHTCSKEKPIVAVEDTTKFEPPGQTYLKTNIKIRKVLIYLGSVATLYNL